MVEEIEDKALEIESSDELKWVFKASKAISLTGNIKLQEGQHVNS
jgi:hypothetical protein